MKNTSKERPAIVTDAHLVYLDELRKSGVTKISTARAYLRLAFADLSPKEAAEVVQSWMATFEERHPR